MVFANLPGHEKDAFFSLLDELSTDHKLSNPELIYSLGGSASEASPGGAAASAVHRALASNPEATSKLISAGVKHGVPKSSPYAAAASNPEISNAVGRVAAASLAFSSPSNASAGESKAPPPVAPRKPFGGTTGASGLTPNRKFGDVDTSSVGGMFSSLRSSTSAKLAHAPPVTPAPARKNPFAPPARGMAAAAAQEPVESEEPEADGEWAEALHDYTSQEATDLEISEGQRILVTERTSEHWWTGEVDGKSGLFPASYVRIL